MACPVEIHAKGGKICPSIGQIPEKNSVSAVDARFPGTEEASAEQTEAVGIGVIPPLRFPSGSEI